MATRPIVFSWKDEKGEWKVKIIERESFTKIIDSIREGFPENNEITTKISSVLPDVIMIVIDKKRNSDNPESPKIECVTHEKNEIIIIPNHHRIVWGILNEITKEE